MHLCSSHKGGPRGKVVFSCVNAVHLLQSKNGGELCYCAKALKVIRSGPSLVLPPWLEKAALSCQVGLRPGDHRAHISPPWRDPACRKVKLLEPEVLGSIYVVEVVKDPGTGEVSF